MEIVFTILGILICVILLIIIVMYLTFAYQMYKYRNKADVFFSRKNSETIIKNKYKNERK